MQVDGDVILGVFGLVFAATSGLVGVIWSMIRAEIIAMKSSQEKDRDSHNQVVGRLFDELHKLREESTRDDTALIRSDSAAVSDRT